MNMFGMKMAIPMDEAEFDEKENNSLAPQDIKHTGKTKTIAGYKCKQVIGTSSDGDKLEFWYTDALHLVAKGADYSIPGIKGLPLEMDIVQEGMKIKMTATEVSTDKLDSGLFSTEIPAGYKETNMENMGGMMGK